MSDNVFKQRGGVFIGSSRVSGFSATWPFATIQITAEEVRIVPTFFSAPLTIARKDITACTAYKGILTSGVRFHHADSRLKPLIIFWCNASKLLDILENYGYAVPQRATI